MDYHFSRLHQEDVEVAQEVASDQGRPDVMIWVPTEWFLYIEMKVESGEGADQTERYANIRSFDELDIDAGVYDEENQFYLYLAPECASKPKADDFTTLLWEQVAASTEEFLTDDNGYHPARTTAQLFDFVATIRSELTMTEYEAHRKEKIALAIEYYELMVACWTNSRST